MASERLQKYAIDASSAFASDSVPHARAGAASDASAVAFSFDGDDAAASSSTAAAASDRKSVCPSSLSTPKGLFLPPQTGFQRLKERDVHFDYRNSNQIETKLEEEEEEELGRLEAADEEFDLEFQSSDASLIASAKDGHGLFKNVVPPNSLPFVSSTLTSTKTAQYHPHTDENDAETVDDADDDDEWATVEIRHADDEDGDVGVVRSSLAPSAVATSSTKDDSTLVTFAAAISDLRRSDAVSSRQSQMTQPRSEPTDTSGCCGAFLRRIGFPPGAPPLSPASASTRDFIFSLAATPFDDDDPLHPRILRTLYHRLRPRDFSSSTAVKRYGKHWEEIGFQGVDPSTDLRGVGLLGLVCLLNWFVDESSSRIAVDRIYQLSLDPVQNFPFAVTSINVTRMCLQQLKRGRLDRFITKAERSTLAAAKSRRRGERSRGEAYGSEGEDVCLASFSLFYRALFYRLYVEWRDGKKTIADSGFVLKSLEKVWASNPDKCVAEFRKERLSSSAGKTSGNGEKVLVGKKKAVERDKAKRNARATSSNVQTFTNLSDL